MKYKIIKRGQPGVIGGGTPKYYATPVYSGEINLAGLGKKLSSRSTVTKTDAVAVLSGLVDLISEALIEGKVVRLGELGSFRISINSRGEDQVEDVSSRSIRKGKVLFRPDAEFINNLSALSFEKVRDVSANPDESVDDDSTAPDQAA